MSSPPTQRRTAGVQPGTQSPAVDGELVAMQRELELDTLRDELADLEKSRQHYADLYDFAPIGYLSLDRHGCIHAVNVTGARMLGQRRDLLFGKPLLPVIAAPDRRKFLHHLTQLRRGHKEASTELRLGLRPPFRPVELISVRPDKSQPGGGFRTAIVDLTERKAAETALRESEQRFRQMADFAPVMIWVSGLDKACNYFNQVWLDFTGRPLVQEIGEGWAAGVHPDDRARCQQIYEEAFEARRSFKMEYRLLRHDGQYRWVLDHGTPRFASPGEFLGYIGSCIDITERRAAEVALRAAEGQLRLVTNIAPVMLNRCSRDLRYLFVNQAYAEFLGRKPREIVGKLISEVLSEAAYKIIVPHVEKVLAGESVEFDTEWPDPPDNPRFQHTAYTPELDAQGNVVGWVAAITDITQIKREERRNLVRGTIIRALAEVTTVREASTVILQTLCGLTHWDAGALWLVNPSDEKMDCMDFWHRLDITVPEFEADTRQRQLTRDDGVVGKVWSTGEILFMPDLTRESDFRRATTAGRAGLRSGICFPIKANDRVLGVMECYSRSSREVDGSFLNLLSTVGEKLGQFIERRQSEEAIHQSEERLRSILEAALDAIITVDSEGIVTGWNPQASELLGWAAPEAMGRKLVEFAIPPRYRDTYEQGLRTYLETGKSRMLERHVEFAALHRSGREFPVEVAITPVVLEGRLSFSMFAQDITARKQVEDVLRRSREELEQHVKDRTVKLTEALVALRSSETRFRGFVESAPDAVVIADQRGRIVLVNAQTERLFGYARQELERRPMELLLPKRFRRRHKEHRRQYLVESLGRPKENSLELSGLRKDGTEFPIEISLSPLPTPDGRLVCGAIRDITERKRAEEALRESEGRLTAIMEHTPAAMFLKDTHGRYLHFNRQFAQTFHLDLNQAIGKTDRELFPAAKHAIFKAKYSKVIKTQKPIQFELVTQRDDGPHTSIVTKFPLFTAAGKIYAVGGIITDITARKRVEEALQEGKAHYLALFQEARSAQLEARRLSTLVLHAQEAERKRISRELHDEVGQSLTAINMSLTALRRKVAQKPGPPMAELDDIEQLLAQTMETVHDFARELRPSMLDELGLLPALRSHLKSLATRTGLNLRMRADSGAEELGEEEKLVLFRVVQESLNNVVKHAGASRVELTVRKTDKGVLVSIEDNGKSFHLKSDGAVKGQRLGLLGMQERVRLINGRFAIVPRPGKGTKVWAAIPLKPPTEAVPESNINKPPPPPLPGVEKTFPCPSLKACFQDAECGRPRPPARKSLAISGRFSQWKSLRPGRAHSEGILQTPLVHQSLLQGVVGQLCVVLHVHFGEDAATVGADGADAQRKFLGDLPDGFAGGDQAENEKFPIRESLVRRFPNVHVQISGHSLREHWTHVTSARHNFLDGADQLFTRAFLG